PFAARRRLGIPDPFAREAERQSSDVRAFELAVHRDQPGVDRRGMDLRMAGSGRMSYPGFKLPDTRTPLKNARNWGSAKSGVGHWWTQRLTAAALVALTLWFVVTVLTFLGSDFDTARETLAEPWNVLLMILF